MSAVDRLRGRAAAAPVASERVIEIPLSKVRFDPTQPRKAFHHPDGRIAEKDEAYIAELAESIRVHKLIEAITVQEMPDGTYLVVVGECRTRAHMLLALPTIRASVRNDLVDPAQRLLFQIAENVNRKDLGDDELAESILLLLNGSETVKPMKQVEIAAAFGKSEGWVSKYVKYGDDELQRVWVKTGIADTVDKLAWLAAMSPPLQVDVRRRVALPETDSEWLAKPLTREVIERLKREAKDGPKAEYKAPVVVPPAGNVPAAGTGAVGAIASVGGGVVAGGAGASAPATGNPAPGDSIGRAFAELAADGRAKQGASGAGPTAGPVAPPVATGGYQLSPDAHMAILESIPGASAGGGSAGDVVPAPVRCRAAVSNVLALVQRLKSNASNVDILRLLDGVQCEINLPGPLAQLIANELAGIIVSENEVPAIVQNKVAKLA